METIFIVEDNLKLGNLYKKALSGERREILHLQSIRDTLARLETLVPDVITLDMSMPDGDGLDVIRYLQADPKFDRTQIAVITGESGYESRIKAVGVRHFLHKPVSIFALRDLIAQML